MNLQFACMVFVATHHTQKLLKKNSNVTNERWQKTETSMSPKHRYENIDVKNIDIDVFGVSDVDVPSLNYLQNCFLVGEVYTSLGQPSPGEKCR